MSPMTQSAPSYPPAAAASSGGRLVSVDGRLLPLRECSLEVVARGGLAQVIVRHRFRNDSPDPLQVTFQLPLPADGAVGAYTFIVGDRRIVGEIDRREEARKRYEDAILEGRSAALLEQDRSALFTQEIGNIPPLSEVTCELIVDQKLRWLEDGQWEWRFPTVVAPRYLGAEGMTPDASRITVEVSEQPLPARATLSMIIGDAIVDALPTSPTHGLVSQSGDDGYEVVLAGENGAMLDRDIVVRWSVANTVCGVTLDVARTASGSRLGDSMFGLLTVTPPAPKSQGPGLPRDLIILLDTSGSMSGLPLQKAQQLLLKIIVSLGPRDQLELIEFSDTAHRWRALPCAANETNLAAATAWVRSRKAGGSTEMQSGVLEALKSLRPDAQRQVLLVTDGDIGFEGKVVGSVLKATPKGTRVHAVGIGSASNRSLTAAVARAGGGSEFIVDLDENVNEAAGRILARLSTPLVVNLKVSGSALHSAACECLPDLFGGAPSLVPVRLKPEGGELIVEGRTHEGPWMHRSIVHRSETGAGSEAIARVFGRELVEDLEMQAAGGRVVDKDIERIGLEFQISTRMTSWVAISEQPTVDPLNPIRRTRIVQQLPYGMSAEGLGLRTAVLANRKYARGLNRQFNVCYMSELEPMLPPQCDVHAELQLECESREIEHEAEFAHLPGDIEFDGHLISFSNGQMVIEFELDQDLAWLPQAVEVKGARKARIDSAATTRMGTYQTGQRIRLVLTDVPPRSTRRRLDLIIVRLHANGRIRIKLNTP